MKMNHNMCSEKPLQFGGGGAEIDDSFQFHHPVLYDGRRSFPIR